MSRIAIFFVLWLGVSFCAKAFEVNGRHWDTMPIPYYINPTDCPALDSGESIDNILQMAVQNWSQVVCDSVEFSYMGHTDATWDKDGKNTVFCVNHDWNYTPGAAGATLWLPTNDGEPQEVDLALNVSDYEWRMGGADATTTDIIDPVAVVSHELGHWLGLGHSADPYATMYFAYLPNGLGASLSADDEAGICSLYPSGTDMCTSEDDCDEGYSCISIESIPVCQEPHDGPGATCSKDYINCDGMCWVSFYECSQLCIFTKLDSSDGYCAPLCNDTDCPEGFNCQYFAQQDVNICIIDQQDEDGGMDGQDGDDRQDGAAISDSANAYDGDEQADHEEDAGTQTDLPADQEKTDAGIAKAQDSGCGCSQSSSQPNILFLFLFLFIPLLWRKSRG